MPNLVKFKEDPDAMLVMSLEDYDEVTAKAAKAAIMTKDVVGKTPPVTQVTFKPGASDHVEKMSVMRKRIAEHMVQSVKTSAHVHSVFEVNFGRIAKIR